MELIVYRDAPEGPFALGALVREAGEVSFRHAESYSSDWKSFTLAPAYDLVSTTYFARFSREMGMAIGDHANIEEATTEDFAMLAKQLGVGMGLLRGIAETFAARILPSLREEGERLGNEGYSAAPYIADDIEEDIAPRLEILASL